MMMKLRSALAMTAATLMIATAAYAQSRPHDEIQSPRGQEIQSPRS